MAGERVQQYDLTVARVSGLTLYAKIVQRHSSWMWCVGTEKLTPLPLGGHSGTPIELVEVTGKNIYGLNMPEKLPTGEYDVIIMEQAGAAPATTDSIVAALEYNHRGKVT